MRKGSEPLRAPDGGSGARREIEIAGGSVQGRDHRLRGAGNQDAYTWRQAGGVAVAVVADGCGSSPHSETGARIGARLLRESCMLHAAGLRAPHAAAWLEERRQDVLAPLRVLARQMADAREHAACVRDHFLFTLQLAVLTPACTLVAGIGDGYLAMDREAIDLVPEGNAPPYLGYALLPPSCVDMDPARFRFEVHGCTEGPAPRRILLGTDGVRDLATGDGAAGALDAFREDDRFYRNPWLVSRELGRLAADRLAIDWETRQKTVVPGILPDDTTLVALRVRGEAA